MTGSLPPYAAHILKFVSGRPKAVRERRLLLVLQAFIDDSRTDGKVLFMSGFISNVESWLSHSDEWDALLKRLELPVFKMSKQWTKGQSIATEQAEWFYRIAEKHVQGWFAVAIDERLLAKVVDDLQLPAFHKNPYYMVHSLVMDGLLQIQDRMGLMDPIDIIFDKQSGIEDAITVGWPEYRDTIPEGLRDRVGSLPRFETDEDELPLQAADLSAWWLRRHWLEKDGAKEGMSYPYPWKPRRSFDAFVVMAGEATIKRRLSDVKREYIQQIWEADPTDIHLKDAIPDDAWDFRELRTKLRK